MKKRSFPLHDLCNGEPYCVPQAARSSAEICDSDSAEILLDLERFFDSGKHLKMSWDQRITMINGMADAHAMLAAIVDAAIQGEAHLKKRG